MQNSPKKQLCQKRGDPNSPTEESQQDESDESCTQARASAGHSGHLEGDSSLSDPVTMCAGTEQGKRPKTEGRGYRQRGMRLERCSGDGPGGIIIVNSRLVYSEPVGTRTGTHSA